MLILYHGVSVQRFYVYMNFREKFAVKISMKEKIQNKTERILYFGFEIGYNNEC